MLVESFSGVRGIYKADLDEIVAKKYCQAYLQFLNKNRIVIGCDTRYSSESLKKAMISVIPYAIDVGIASTPMIELAVRSYNADGGVIITGSHCPEDQNGFKFLRKKDGALLSPSDMIIVIDNYKKGILKFSENKEIENKNEDIKRKYIEFCLNYLTEEDIESIKSSNFKIITDPNGGTGFIIDGILDKLNVENVKVNYEPGKFSRIIEPNQESLKYLVPLIKKYKADFAVGFDCDADRAKIVTDRVIDGNYVLALGVDEVLSRTPGIIIINDATSYLIRDLVAKKYKNSKVIEVEVGEINVVDEMIKSNAVVGGEGSCDGGIFPPSTCRDGILATLFILRLLAKERLEKPEISINEILDTYPKYYNIKAKVKCIPEEQVRVREKLKEYFSKQGYEIQETGEKIGTGERTGGLKAIIDNSFLYFRVSGTEKTAEGDVLFRIIADSKDEDKARSLLELGKQVFNSLLL